MSDEDDKALAEKLAKMDQHDPASPPKAPGDGFDPEGDA